MFQVSRNLSFNLFFAKKAKNVSFFYSLKNYNWNKYVLPKIKICIGSRLKIP